MVDQPRPTESLRKMPSCAACPTPAKLKCRCGTRYCSKGCQAADWKAHRATCTQRTVAAEAARDRKSPRPPAARPVSAAPPRTPRTPPRPPSAPAPCADEAATDDDEAAPEASAAPSAPPGCAICGKARDPNGIPSLLLCCASPACGKCAAKLLKEAAPCPRCGGFQPTSNRASFAALKRHTAKDHPAAIAHLGAAYERGALGLAASPAKAAYLYHRAAELGDGDGAFALGRLFEAGAEGVPCDHARAAQYLRVAADRGDARAMFHLGLCKHHGRGVSRCVPDAVRLYQLAAADGLAEANFALGFLYATGESVEENVAQARHLYKRAADRGHADAAAALTKL